MHVILDHSKLMLRLTLTAALCGLLNTSCSISASIEEIQSRITSKQFKLIPPSADITEGGVIQINGSDGKPPYIYEKVSGAGTLAADGTFTSPAGSSMVMVKGTDSAGKNAFAIFNIVNKPELQPGLKTLAINNKFHFSVIGGKAPYTFRVLEAGRGTVTATGEYTAPATLGTATLEVEDILGGKDQAPITIIDKLVITPTPVTVGPNTSKTFLTTGGVPPITFVVESGGGAVNATTGVYVSPGVAGTAVVTAQDSLGNEAKAQINITNPLQINPIALELIVNSTYTFSANGGVPPYAYSLVSGAGSIAASMGIYMAPATIGTAVVRVTDSQGSTSNASININLDLNFVLPNILLLVGETTDLSTKVVGGAPPLSYSVSSGAGTVNATSGLFTASMSAGTYTATVTDSQGHQAQAAVIVQPLLTISPVTPEMMAGTTLSFSASGGFGPYTFTVPSGGGGGGFSGSIFTAPSTAQVVTVRVTDSLSHTATTTVTVRGPLQIAPLTAAVIVGHTQTFTGSGGVPPYSYSLVSGGGSVSNAGLYTAPATAGTAVVRITDSQNNYAEASIRILEPLLFIPSSMSMAKSSILNLLASGGEPAYRYTILTGLGTINSSTGQFTSASTAGIVSVQVEDNVGNTATGTITVYESVIISPVTSNLVINETQTFTASGGQIPYAYSLVSGGGTVNAVTGVYTAPATPGTAVVRVTDNLGQTSEANITINAALTIAPTAVTLAVTNSLQFNAAGGVPPYTFSLQSGTGGTTVSGLYTAPASIGADVIKVTDAGGRTATANITINAALTITPASLNLKYNDTHTFVASNGVGPYTFSILSGDGTINAGTGAFVAPAAAGTTIVRVTDSLSNTAQANITIASPVEISPATKSLALNETFTFLALNGLPPYTFSKVSGGGSINASTGLFTSPAAAGTTVIRVTDSLSQTADATINIYQGLDLTPDLSTIAINQIKILSIAGGVGPYTYSVLSGTGSFNDGTMTYSAAATPSTTKIKVIDSLNNFDIATVLVVGTVTIAPTTITAIVNENVNFTASGGETAYVFSIVSGGGSINASTGVFTAPASVGTTVVRVTDALGQTADATVTVNPALTISPTTASLAIGNSQQFTGSGGVGPYTYSVFSGSGTINVTTGLFTAGGSSGTSVVRVTDAGGRTADATVTIAGALAISPATKDLVFTGTQTFTATGGVGPYSYTVVVPGAGSVGVSTGAYVAPSVAGTETVRVTDSLGNTSNATVTIIGPVQIAPTSISLIINGTTTFTASGGKTPYAYSVVTGGGGTINSSTGAYTAPATVGSYTIRVTDALGQTSDSIVATNAVLDLSPNASTIIRSGTKVLTVSGGVAPLSYSVISGGGTFTSGTMTYTAPATATTAQVRVTDALSNTDTVTITVVDNVTISPTAVTLAVNETQTFTASSGLAPYAYSIVSGAGSVNASTGVFTAPASAGTTVVRVTDSLSQTADATVTVVAALSISPPSVTLAINNSQTFTAAGGIGPYTYALVSGTGSITAGGVYTAPAAAGSAVVKVTDSGGRTANATITVNGALAISPTTKDLIYAGTQTFTATGGVGPYSYTVVIPGAGSVGVSTGAYVAPSVAGTETLRLADSLNNTADAVVTIFTPVQISPTTKTLVIGEAFTFTASGGKTPYAYSISVGGGTLNTSTGVLTASNAPGTYTVRVTDALGQISDSVLTIESAIDLTPDASTIKVGQTQVLSISGGVAPLTYSVVSGTGTFDSGTMTYTATTTTTTAQVKVTDNLGYNDTVTINVGPEVPASLYFVTSAQSVSAGACSTVTEVGVKDTYGNITTANASTTINLAATNITFYSDAACSSAITSRTLANGGTKVSFYFKSNVSGMDMVTATATGLTLATQTETIAAATLAEVRFSPAALTVLAGDCSAVSQLRLTDTYGNPGSPASSVSVALAGAGVNYYSDASCATGFVSPVVLTNGTPTKNIYVLKTLASTTTITGIASGYTTGNLSLTVNPNVPYKVAFITQPSGTAWEGVTFTNQPKLGIYDQYDNFLSTASTTITLTARTDDQCNSSASGTLSATTNPLSTTGGMAQFAGVNYAGTGTIYLRAAVAGMSNACSNAVIVTADYSQSVSKLAANIPSDNLAEATLLIIPKKGSVALGAAKVIEITSSSSTVSMTCNGSACSACQTPAATCVKAYDNGQGAYSISIKDSVAETPSFTVRHNDAGVLNGITTLTPTFNTANFTSMSATASVTSAHAALNLYLTGGTITFDNTTVGQTFGDVFIRGATVTHTATTTTVAYRLDINVASLTLQSGSINAAGRGYLTTGANGTQYSYGASAPSPILGSTRNGASSGGGSHGGMGGSNNVASASGPTYDDYRDPYYPGGASYVSGGGVVRISTTGTCTINSGATITTAGTATNGGAGGSIKLACAGFAGNAGVAALNANGGTGSTTAYGGGGGGRIALVSSGEAASFAGTFAFPIDDTKLTAFNSVVQARGGANAPYGGAAGTVYLKHSGLTYGGLIANNGNTASAQQTVLASINNTAGTVSSSTITLGTALSTGYTDIYKNLRLRTNLAADNGTPTNLLDDNIVTITTNSVAVLTVSGSLSGVTNGVSMRSLEILDYLNVGGAANLGTASDIVVLSGNFVSTTQLNFTDGVISLSLGAATYPEVNQITMTTGSFTGVNANMNNLVVSGATVNFSGTLTSGTLTVNSGSYTGGVTSTTNTIINGGAYTATTTSTTQDLTIAGGTNISATNNVGRDLIVSGGTSTLDTSTITRDFNMSAGTLYHTATTSTVVNRFQMTVGNEFNLLGGNISGAGRGYLPTGVNGQQQSFSSTVPSSTLGTTRNGTSSGGGSHGGRGGTNSVASASGATYDDYRDPYYPGGASYVSGGGVVRIAAVSNCTINSGASINVVGTATNGGGGGSIKLACGGFKGTAGTAALIANGGTGSSTSFGGGGGGRIALISSGDDTSFAGSFAFPNDDTKMTAFNLVVQARGGANSPYSGAAGTVFLKHSGLTYGGLIANNGGTSSNQQTTLPAFNNTAGTVSGSSLPLGTSMAAGYTDLYKNMRLRPNIAADNGTPSNLLDDNIVTISSHTLSALNITGSLVGVTNGVSMRTLEILDYLHVGGSGNLGTESDLVVLNGNFVSPTQLIFTDGVLSLSNGAASYPGVTQTTLTSGSYNGNDATINSLVVSGATVNYTGTLTIGSLTVNSGSYTGGTVVATTVTLNGGTYTPNTTNTTEDLIITGGTNNPGVTTVGRDMLVSGGTTTLDLSTITRDFSMSAGTLVHTATTTTTVGRFEMSVGNEFKLLGGTISAAGRGYVTTGANSLQYSYGPTGPTTSLGSSRNGASSSGGSHGGQGGSNSGGSAAGAPFDDYRDPYYPGGASYVSGGGVVRVAAASTCTINSGAIITAAGAATNGGGGGSIKLACGGFTGTAGSAALNANGGSGSTVNFGGGGGGRIALISTGNETSFAGSFAFPNDSTKMTAFNLVVQARGGVNGTYTGGAGTVYLKHSDLTYGGLIVNNNGTTGALTKAVATTANTSKINASIDFNSVKVTSAATPFSTMVNYFKGYTIHIWPVTGGNEDPLSGTHTSAVVTSNAANSFVSAGAFGSLTIASDNHNYRIVNQLDALWVGGSATFDLQSSDLILTRSSGSLACDFTNATGGNFTVPVGSKIQTGNNYSSIDCPDSGFTTKGTTINFTKYCNGSGTCL
jgi:hypothetical protein